VGADGVHEEPLEADVARKFLAELMDHKELRGLLSDEHFSVDGTQINPAREVTKTNTYRVETFQTREL
jgi:hypothetical protein